MILAVAIHLMQPACAPLLIPESADEYTVGIRCHY